MTDKLGEQGITSAFFVVVDVGSQYVDDDKLLLYRIIPVCTMHPTSMNQSEVY
ncbi:hypothetical protein VCRA2123O444_130008 [Vibrio crassostreae]|nr:hypothetical protein VCRA2119O431_130095 [Vibrio crassostreae]CAK1762983.1 hypothetical protein VCRA2119O430_140096 [Vibrio crassostreae]CAK2632705.1 hypothetical protein VCRA2126O448_140008 [Vibrio crassostreae]CAK3078578.1 hypothetical protein VCRA2123O445_140008 [Vibrio crassostreae]CAK3208801.1 hypothetical protein VCRA2127O449_140096 [Vibrio crassostreae]